MRRRLGGIAAALIWLIPTLTLLALTMPAAAQGCGPSNPNCIVPTVSPCATDNRAASTAYVTNCGGGGGGPTPQPFTSAPGTLTANGQGTWGATLANGLVLAGQGSSTDLVLENKSAATVCSIATGSSTLTCNTLSAQSLTLTLNPLPIASGGTGAGSQQAAFNALAPPPTRPGDLITWNGTNWIDFPGNNTATQCLTENASGVPAWGNCGFGTVTSVGAGCGTTTSSGNITTSGIIFAIEGVNRQTGASYAVNVIDCGFLTNFTSNAAVAVSLAQAGTVGFNAGWFNDMCPIGSGAVTITPSVSTIGGAPSLTLTAGKCARIISDGTNYQTIIYGGTGGGGGTPGGANTQLQYNASGAFGGIVGATTNGTVVTFASSDLALAGATSGTTLLNATATASGTLTLPAATDQLVARATTDTLTNKTYDTAGTGNVFKINGTQITAISGNTGTVGTTTGTLTSTHCVNIDASGNLKDAGAACAGGLVVNSTTVSGGAAGNMLYTDGSLLQATGGVVWNSTGKVTHTINALASSPTDALVLVNTTAALVGAQVQSSPSLHFSGQGWSGAASVATDMTLSIVPSNSGSGAETMLVFAPTVSGQSASAKIAICSDPAGAFGTSTFITGVDGSSLDCSNNVGWTGIGTGGASQNGALYSNAGRVFVWNTNGVQIGSPAHLYAWSPNAAPGGGTANDTGISRDAAAVIDIGNGTAQDTSGAVKVRRIAGQGTPTANVCAGFAAATGATDLAGTITYTSATTCSITFAHAFTNTPFCVISPGSAASTSEAVATTSGLTATFGTAQTAFSYHCMGI